MISKRNKTIHQLKEHGHAEDQRALLIGKGGRPARNIHANNTELQNKHLIHKCI